MYFIFKSFRRSEQKKSPYPSDIEMAKIWRRQRVRIGNQPILLSFPSQIRPFQSQIHLIYEATS
jgi:hypothetical protein